MRNLFVPLLISVVLLAITHVSVGSQTSPRYSVTNLGGGFNYAASLLCVKTSDHDRGYLFLSTGRGGLAQVLQASVE